MQEKALISLSKAIRSSNKKSAVFSPSVANNAYRSGQGVIEVGVGDAKGKAPFMRTESGNLTMFDYDGFRIPKSSSSISSERAIKKVRGVVDPEYQDPP